MVIIAKVLHFVGYCICLRNRKYTQTTQCLPFFFSLCCCGVPAVRSVSLTHPIDVLKTQWNFIMYDKCQCPTLWISFHFMLSISKLWVQNMPSIVKCFDLDNKHTVQFFTFLSHYSLPQCLLVCVCLRDSQFNLQFSPFVCFSAPISVAASICPPFVVHHIALPPPCFLYFCRLCKPPES